MQFKILAEIIGLAKRFNALLLTEDSDFGHWVFAKKEKEISVIFLRYDTIARI